MIRLRLWAPVSTRKDRSRSCWFLDRAWMLLMKMVLFLSFSGEL